MTTPRGEVRRRILTALSTMHEATLTVERGMNDPRARGIFSDALLEKLGAVAKAWTQVGVQLEAELAEHLLVDAEDPCPEEGPSSRLIVLLSDTFHAENPERGAVLRWQLAERLRRVEQQLATAEALIRHLDSFGPPGLTRSLVQPSSMGELLEQLRAALATEPMNDALHRAWSACAGLPGYDKEAWKELEREVMAAEQPGATCDHAALLGQIEALRQEQEDAHA